MKQNKWTQEFAVLASESYEKKSTPTLTIIENGTILPTQSAEGFSWGKGGVLDSNGKFVQASSVGTGGHAFGGKYQFNENKVEIVNETIVFIGIVPKHWGHFLIDTVSRFWIFLSEEYKRYKVAFCGWGWSDTKIDGNFLQTFELMGINKRNLMFIDHPIKASKIIIPEATMEFGATWNKAYRDTINHIAIGALNNEICSKLKAYDRIYFTRTQFLKSKLNEIGEKEIESLFKTAGFLVLVPEKLSIVEQIFYIRNCKIMASMSGTIPHNSVFAKDGMKLIILNRTPIINPPQLRINQLSNTNWVYVDVYTKRMEKNPADYGEGPIQIEITNQLIRYLEDNKFKIDSNVISKIKCIKIKNNIVFYFLLIFKKIKKLKMYSQLKKIYNKYK
jgi:hypothetical protein